MDEMELPEELQTPPEKRLKHTWITEKPRASSFIVAGLSCLVIALASQLYWLNTFGAQDLWPAVHSKIFDEGEWWRAVTAIFAHGDIAHLLSNLYMLSIFVYFVYGYFGLRAFPLLTGLGAIVVNFLSIATYPPNVRLIGASGLVYLLGGFWLTLYLFIQRQYSWSKRLVRVIGMALMVFFPTSFEETTSYRTHFIGFAVGALLALLYFIQSKDKLRRKERFVWIP